MWAGARGLFWRYDLTMAILWLGYDGLALATSEIVAILHYRPALDRQIIAAYGSVPSGIRAVVVTQTGAYLPTRWDVAQLRQHWAYGRGVKG